MSAGRQPYPAIRPRGVTQRSALAGTLARGFLTAAHEHWLCAFWLLSVMTGLRRGEALATDPDMSVSRPLTGSSAPGFDLDHRNQKPVLRAVDHRASHVTGCADVGGCLAKCRLNTVYHEWPCCAERRR